MGKILALFGRFVKRRGAIEKLTSVLGFVFDGMQESTVVKSVYHQ